LGGSTHVKQVGIFVERGRELNRQLKSLAGLLFGGVIYIILAGGLSPWTQLPTLGDTGFTLVFLAFSVLHCAASIGWKRTGLFFAVTAVISYLLEEIGVRTGWIYGAYHYSAMLGAKLGDVPILIPLAWFMMIYPSWIVARALLRGVDAHSAVGICSYAVIAAIVMTAWDAIMDPGMSAAGNWIWERGGSYFGVPFQNYFGWLLTTFLVYVGAGLLWRKERDGTVNGNLFAALPVMVYAFYGLSYMTPRPMPALQIVALFAMVMPGLLALMRSFLSVSQFDDET
jgi:putative membrane protein